MHTSDYIYHHNDQALQGYLAFHDPLEKPRPAVLVFHDWSGRNAFACKKAEMLADMGYLGFAVDLYGDARVAETLEEKKDLMQPFVDDRALLRDRVLAAFNALCDMDEVNNQQIAAIGFCFGGMCALDLARAGADVKGVVSFHGLLNQPENLEAGEIKARILTLHGYDDPMVEPEQVQNFCQEMTEAGVDWQVHMYGHTKHAFTNPQAHDEDLGTVYDATAASRSLQAMENFMSEIFE